MLTKTKVKIVIIVLCIEILSITITSLLLKNGNNGQIKDTTTDQTQTFLITTTTQMDYQWTDKYETETTEKPFQCNESMTCSSFNCWFFDLFDYCIDSWINDGFDDEECNHPALIYNEGDCCFDIVNHAKLNKCFCYGNCSIHRLKFINDWTGMDLKPKLVCYSSII